MPGNKRIVVVGGVAAGPKAASKARRLDQQAEITIIQREPELSMASCGYPYYVGGHFNDRNALLSAGTGPIRNPAYFWGVKRIIARTETEAIAIDREGKTVRCRDIRTGETAQIAYDRLILATGAVPNVPPIPGVNLEGITTLHNMSDTDYLRRIHDERKAAKAVVIGGGLIGVEACEALRASGIEVTLIELLPQVLSFLDREMARLVENYLRSKSVDVIIGNGVAALLGDDGRVTGVRLGDRRELPCQLAVLAVGVKPNSTLAREAGLAIGATGGVIVNEYLQTSDENIYAAGDCIETKHLITGEPTHAPFGDLANLQGRVAGENAVLGNTVTFPGTIATGICKVFDYAAGATGLNEGCARDAGLDAVTVIGASLDKPGYMDGQLLISKLVVEKKSGRILGAQCVGPGDVSRQIAQWAMAIRGKLTVEDLVNADLPYAPPFSLAIDHGIMMAHIMQNKRKGRLKGISAREVKGRVDSGAPSFIIDVRSPEEYREMRLGVGEKLIPLPTLRDRLDELPEDKNAEIICYCRVSLRAYEASLMLEADGWKNVRVMEGGVVAWPYERET
jgi:NADPH-dependent 2,4-dienoyl-CoA reductase/sulfur reductase-like enzyme/rhodanese-related sulfurtransferase